MAFYTRRKLVITSLFTNMPEELLRDTFSANIRAYKKLQADIHEFDRRREHDPRKTLKWLTDSTDPLMQRERTINVLQYDEK